MSCPNPKDISWPSASILFRKLSDLVISKGSRVPSPYARLNGRCDSFALFGETHSRPNIWRWMRREKRESLKAKERKKEKIENRKYLLVLFFPFSSLFPHFQDFNV